jgi:hypothetical protein
MHCANNGEAGHHRPDQDAPIPTQPVTASINLTGDYARETQAKMSVSFLVLLVKKGRDVQG